ncbi:hypothetical protein [Desulfovibrio sp. MES5]|uniref:hypothetical protein n=1 Tax=Desulfovibrio sp. MES5 TaxID=1899016 RepID=UPI0025C373D9|nr:hypothetical protein [Desulfovibrio sp. MES5]
MKSMMIKIHEAAGLGCPKEDFLYPKLKMNFIVYCVIYANSLYLLFQVVGPTVQTARGWHPG